MIKYLVLISLICNSVFADDVKYLKEKEPAPFAGYLISPERADRVRQHELDYDFANKENELLKSETAILDERIKFANDTNAQLSKQVVDARGSSDKFWPFVGGVTLGILASWAASRAIR